MSTRARIKLIHKGKVLGGIYYGMDGGIWNFAPPLIKALQETTPQNILLNKRLIKFMGGNALYGERDEYLDYLCEVDISQDEYLIRLYKWKQELIFTGTLEQFAAEHGKKDDDDD